MAPSPRFHALAIADIRRETPDAVSIAFTVPDKIKADYPDIPAYETYEELLSAIRKAMVD